jgi:alpha-beta hydrolase superfamily lysophospholipase
VLTRDEVRIDVSDIVGMAGAEIAATVVAPSVLTTTKPIVAVGFAGGGYSKGYWDIQWLGGYSQAEYHASRGWVFAAVDALGVGESSLVDPSLLTFEVMAAANSAATRQIASMLSSGALKANAAAPVSDPYVIGVGQSMGGCVSIVAQATLRAFDALAVLGYSASHTVLPSPQGGVRVTPITRGRTDDEAIATEAAEIGDVHVFAWSFHYDDVDPEIYHEDLRGGYPFRTESVPPWGSATIPPAAASMLAPAVVAGEAAAIDVPVFIGLGERDVCPDPWSEPACYRSAKQVSLCLVDRMAHMHNFASTRHVLWDRLHRWGQSLV